MASIKSTRAMTASADGTDAAAVFNVDTVNGRVDIPNGSYLRFWSGPYSGQTLQINGGTIDLATSSTTPDPGNAGTISGVNAVGLARITPTAAETGIILQAGTVNGQLLIVINEATTPSFSATFAASGTSNVADGANCVIPGGQARLFAWGAASALWFEVSSLNAGALYSAVSATTPDPGANGTIATAGVGVALVTPAANRAGIILAAGTYPGQEVLVVNQSAANTLTAAAAGTSNIADGTSCIIGALNARKFVWVAGSTNLWYRAA